MAGLTEGIEAAEAEATVRCRLIADMDRAYGPSAGLELVEQVGEPGGRAGPIGSSGSARIRPSSASTSPRSLRRSRPRAGSGSGGRSTRARPWAPDPENIRIALDALGPERIDHGVAIAEDPALMRRVADDGVPLTVCPTSNVIIANRYRSLGEHPLMAMREAGIWVTINTDDPAMEDIDIGESTAGVAAAYDLDVTMMGRLRS